MKEKTVINNEYVFSIHIRSRFTGYPNIGRINGMIYHLPHYKGKKYFKLKQLKLKFNKDRYDKCYFLNDKYISHKKLISLEYKCDEIIYVNEPINIEKYKTCSICKKEYILSIDNFKCIFSKNYNNVKSEGYWTWGNKCLHGCLQKYIAETNKKRYAKQKTKLPTNKAVRRPIEISVVEPRLGYKNEAYYLSEDEQLNELNKFKSLTFNDLSIEEKELWQN